MFIISEGKIYNRSYINDNDDSLPMNYVFFLQEQCEKHMEYLKSIEIKCFSWGEFHDIDTSRINQCYYNRDLKVKNISNLY